MVSLEDIKLPPHHIEAEKSVLSGVLMDNEVMYLYESMALTSTDFYKREHGSIYAAIMALRERRATIDAVTLSDQLTKDGTIDEVGGIDYLYELSTYLLSTSSCGEYAQIVKEKATLRWILKVCQWIIWDVYDQKETADIMEAIEKKIFNLTQVKVWWRVKHVKEVLDMRVEEYMAIVDDPWRADEFKTFAWYKQIDEMLGGFKPGELIVLAARPAMGKTAFALNLLIHASINQWKTSAFFSLEMSNEQIVDRLLSGLASVSMWKISRGDLNADDFERMGDAISTLGEANIYVDDQWTSTVWLLRSKLRRLKVEKGNLDLVVIDYLQLMSGSWSRFAGNRVQEVSEISRAMKELAKELTVPIIVLSQLSRAVEQRVDKEPQLSDLRDSGAIEQDADAVMMLYREEYYDNETDRKWATDVFIRKNRNGPIGDAELFFQKQNMKFLELQTD